MLYFGCWKKRAETQGVGSGCALPTVEGWSSTDHKGEQKRRLVM